MCVCVNVWWTDSVLELALLSEQGHGRYTADATRSRDGFGALGRSSRVVLSVYVTGTVLNCGDDRFDNHRVGGSFRGITNVLQIFDVGRIEGGYVGGLGRGSHIVRVRAQHR